MFLIHVSVFCGDVDLCFVLAEPHKNVETVLVDDLGALEVKMFWNTVSFKLGDYLERALRSWSYTQKEQIRSRFLRHKIPLLVNLDDLLRSLCHLCKSSGVENVLEGSDFTWRLWIECYLQRGDLSTGEVEVVREVQVVVVPLT